MSETQLAAGAGRRQEAAAGAGQFPWLDDPGRFAATVAGFLRPV
ncbi:hypothetical protein ACFY1L_44835 [Streptomyces sp. NPDC001663]